MGDIVYRGEVLEFARNSLLDRGRVQGREVPVYRISEDVDVPEKPTGIADADPDYEADSVWLTGGFTESWGTGIHFGGAAREIPVTFAFENGSALRADRVSYNLDWMNMNDGALGHIDTLATGEIRQGPRLVGLSKTNSEGDPYFYEWGQESLRRQAESNTYEDEQEMIAFGARFVSPDRPKGAITIVQDGALAPTVEGALKELGYGFSKTTALKDDPQGAANLISEEIGREIAEYAGEHYVAVVGSRFRARKGEDQPGHPEEVEAVAQYGSSVAPEDVPEHLLPV